MSLISFSGSSSQASNYGAPLQPVSNSINARLKQAVFQGVLPSVNLLKFSLTFFNLYANDNQPFPPSEAVREKLLDLAKVTLDNYKHHLNFANLSSQDLALLFRIIKSYSKHYPNDDTFRKISNVLEEYLVYLCSADAATGKATKASASEIIESLKRFNDLFNVGNIITRMEKALERTSDVLKSSMFQSLPPEILLHILSYLGMIDLIKTAKVCKNLRVLSYDNSLWKRELSCLPGNSQIYKIGKDVWEKHVDLKKHGLVIEDLPEPSSRLLVKSIKMASQVENTAGFTQLIIPKGLTFDKLTAIALEPKIGNPTGYVKECKSIPEQLPVEQTYEIMISRSVIKETRNKTYDRQEEVINRIGFDVPRLIEVTSLIFLTYISSDKEPPTTLFPSYPQWIVTRCSDELGYVDGHFCKVGGFATNFNYAGYVGLHSTSVTKDEQNDYLGMAGKQIIRMSQKK